MIALGEVGSRRVWLRSIGSGLITGFGYFIRFCFLVGLRWVGMVLACLTNQGLLLGHIARTDG